MKVPAEPHVAAIVGVGLHVPGYASAADWIARQHDPEAAPSGALIERRSRRRSSPLTKALADAYAEALEQSGLERSTVASVFGSALGEASTMIGLLDTMWRDGGPLSPMAFAMSVHNAAAGVVSISTENRGYTTSLGADFDTPAMSIVEALGLLATGHDAALVVCGDEGVPEDLVPEGKGWAMAAGAIALVRPEDAPADAPRLTAPRIVPAGDRRESVLLTGAQLPYELVTNPCCGVIDLVDAVLREHSGAVALDRGRGQGWTVQLERP